ncbi:hypothetical protein BU23DRAFT_496265 [Bimuria novae-zelandiae CBS 107.79]|uniref:C3H1-type domain-containing protein n=1 Tax=Bimuria novae-zelandiae CBS 107.79 TaxID=1447943 RepID=A0A6A5VQP8_9PLEO|nr:hypothetical protein BU23DRAFT_496265 [Bimuria novae-zelandiae CBS 107.79]
MATDLAAGSPLAQSLQNLVQPKLAEFGWTTGGDDTTLFDYILLMLSNGKNEEQVATELSNDLLDEAEGENTDTHRFARWLFEQVDQLRGNAPGSNAQAGDNQMDDAAHDYSALAQDMEMDSVVAEGADASSGTIPTGPKAMRNGSGPKQARGGRMVNQANRQMSRNDDPLHRVRGSQGAGRINSHSREPPKGPRGQNLNRGADAMANGRGTSNVNVGPPMNGMGMGMGMPGMPMPMGQNMAQFNAQQQMALMSMYEQQANLMQQIFSGQTPQPFVNPNFQKKKSFTPRGSQGNRHNLPPSTKFTKKEGDDESMADGPAAKGDGMQFESSRQGPDASTTMCHFNQRCMKADCPFVHSSPAAPKNAVVDMTETCTFGAACKNFKCVGKHPSPAKKQQFQAEQECQFFPNCRDPANCPYKHPVEKPCRNGADCTTPGCTFWHSSVVCKFNPCKNINCIYKHPLEGQKKSRNSHVWVAQPKEEEKKEHVSERKFIDEEKAEELIIPGQNEQQMAEAAL